MQKGQRIYKDCIACRVTGKQYSKYGAVQDIQTEGSVEIDCPVCNGLTMVPWGWLRDEKEETMPGEEA